MRVIISRCTSFPQNFIVCLLQNELIDELRPVEMQFTIASDISSDMFPFTTAISTFPKNQWSSIWGPCAISTLDSVHPQLVFIVPIARTFTFLFFYFFLFIRFPFLFSFLCSFAMMILLLFLFYFCAMTSLPAMRLFLFSPSYAIQKNFLHKFQKKKSPKISLHPLLILIQFEIGIS